MARTEPRRVRHGRRSTWVEEFLVQWGPEHCIFREALEQYNLEFDIVSITNLDDKVPTQDLQTLVTDKLPTRAYRRAHRRPPLTTNCIMQIAPSPQGPLYIRSIAGGPQTLDAFLEREPLPPPTLPISVGTPSRSTPINRSSSAQAPTRAKSRAAAPLTPPQRGGTLMTITLHRPQPAHLCAHIATSSR